MSLPRFSVNQSLFVNLVSLLLVIMGIATVLGMNREVFPNVSFDWVTVTTVYPGSTPLDVEKLVTVPIENEIKEVDGIKEISSSSTDSVSSIGIKLDPDTSNKQKVIRDIQTAVDRVNDLPSEVEDPLVEEVESKFYPVIEVSLSGDMSEKKLREYVDMLEDEIEDIKGVAKATKSGYRDREIHVLVDPEKMKENYVSIDEMEIALAARNISQPAGRLDTKDIEFSVRTTGEFTTVGEISNVIIRANDSGNWLRIKDVAEVKDTFKDENIITRTLGTRSINLLVLKKESGDAITIVDNVKKVCDKFLTRIPDTLEVSYVNDYSFFVRRRLNVLKNNATWGLFFVVITMLVFFERRIALMTVLGIPIAFFTTFIVMNALGVTINMISMFGLVVVLGMLVDDGIIVAENVYRYIEEGLPPRKAAVKGAEEVMGAVCAAVFTTIAAYSPLFFMSGIIGKFIINIPIVVCLALLASLAEALIILPSHLADFVKVKVSDTGEKINSSMDYKWFKKLIAFYTRIVKAAIKRKYLVLAAFTIVLIFSMGCAVKVIKFVLFPKAGINYLFVQVEAPIGTPLKKTSDMMAPIEDIVAKLPPEEMEAFVTSVGNVQEDRQDPFAEQASHIGQIVVYLTPEQDRKRMVEEIIEELRENTKDIKGFTDLRFHIPEAGPPVGKAVEARIRGENFEKLDEIAFEYMEYLKTIEGTTDINWDHKPGKEEIRVIVDNNKATMAGLSVGQIAKTVRGVFEGIIATKIKPVKAEEETDVIIRFSKGVANSVDVFDDVYVANSFGNRIKLTKVAEIKKVTGTTTIKHLNGKRVVTASANVDNKKITSIEVNNMLIEKFKDIGDKHMGYSVKYGGEQEETIESMKNLLKSFVFAFLIVYLILASFFKSIIQPFVVMMAVPFGLIGVVFAFYIHGMPLSFMAILGVVSLVGVVVNDAIVLVDFINKLRAKGMQRYESIVKAGQMRIRPVLLTTITTVGGLSSVAYGLGGKDPFLVPMALAICWGLTFATILTLIIIPCIYSILDDFALKLTHHSSIIECEKVNGNCK